MRDKIIGEITKEYREKRKEIEELIETQGNITDRLKNERDTLSYNEYMDLEHRLIYIDKNIDSMISVANGIEIAREIVFNI